MLAQLSVAGGVMFCSNDAMKIFRFHCVGLVFTAAWAFCGCGTETDLQKEPIEIPTVVLASQAEIDRREVAEGSYIVAFRAPSSDMGGGFSSFRAEYRAFYQPLADVFLPDTRIKDLDFITSIDLSFFRADQSSFARTMGASFFKKAFLDDGDEKIAGLAEVVFSDQKAAREVLKEWEKNKKIWFADPNYVSRTSQQSTSIFADLKTQYEEIQGTAWWLKQIKVPGAFGAIAGMDASKRRSDSDMTNDPPVIAVMDSGVDYEHPALKNQIWTNEQVGEATCANDEHGCNTTGKVSKGQLGDGNVFPVGTSGPGEECVNFKKDCKHGTHVAGIIAGNLQSGIGGVCPFCKIMAVKIVGVTGDSDPSIPDDAILRGFKYVSLFRRKSNSINMVRIINSSFGKLTRSRSTALLVRLLKESGSGALVIGAAGNEETMRRSWPAAVTEAIAVSAVDENNQKAQYSNFGPWVDIAAPGGTESSPIISTIPGSRTGGGAGTSQATPMVAGVAGLIVGLQPDISFNDLRTRLLTTADPTLYEGPQRDNYDPQIEGESIRRPLLGSGVVDAMAAVNNTAQGVSLGEVLDRVGPTCGGVGSWPAQAHTRTGLGLILAVIPVIFALMGRFRLPTAFGRKIDP